MQRVILLGASNLTYALPLLFESLRSALPHPLQIVAAHGHGRSFGMWSRVLCRSLPGIDRCRLWSDLESSNQQPDKSLALITDIGNDLLYGADVDQITGWVDSCLTRLAQQRAEIVMTAMPMVSVERLSAWRYYLTRAVFFPTSRVSWPTMLDRVHRLDESLRKVAAERNVALVEPDNDWYGLDPIHIRATRRARAWRSILSHWSVFEQPPEMKRPSPSTALRLWRLRPAERRICGRRQIAEQPVWHHNPEVTFWLY